MSFLCWYNISINKQRLYDNLWKPIVKVKSTFWSFIGVLEGYNGTILAYGQTTSGKTYTMIGDILSQDNKGINLLTIDQLLNHSSTISNEH